MARGLIFLVLFSGCNISSFSGSERPSGLVGEWDFSIQNSVAETATLKINEVDPGRNDANMVTGDGGFDDWSALGSWGVTLDGTDDYIRYADVADLPASFDLTANWSIGGIVRVEAGNGNFTNFFGFSEDPASPDSDEGVWLGESSGNWKISSNGETAGTGGTATDGQVYHIMLTWDGTNFRSYIDAALDQTVSPGGSDWQTADWVVTGWSDVGGDDNAAVTIYKARLWDVTLTLSEIWNDLQSYRAQ